MHTAPQVLQKPYEILRSAIIPRASFPFKRHSDIPTVVFGHVAAENNESPKMFALVVLVLYQPCLRMEAGIASAFAR